MIRRQTPDGRMTDMTLEKLLIFGFALAALFAITTVGLNMMTDRGDQNTQYEGEIDSLASSGF
jgi:predicted Kef-type K+ transport protein